MSFWERGSGDPSGPEDVTVRFPGWFATRESGDADADSIGQTSWIIPVTRPMTKLFKKGRDHAHSTDQAEMAKPTRNFGNRGQHRDRVRSHQYGPGVEGSSGSRDCAQ